MTPYMTPHTSQTPRYGQMTPTQQGQFLRPGAPVSRAPNYRASPFTSGTSPRVVMPPVQHAPNRRYSATQEDEDWDKAADAWEASRNKKGSTPRDSMERSTPRG